MSSISFGQKIKNAEQAEVDLSFNLFSFGEPTSFYLYDNLLRYLPKYIVKNKLIKNLMLSIAISLVKLQNEIYKIPTYELQGGKKSLKFANEDCQLFISGKKTDAEIVDALKAFFEIHQARGTKSGILADIKRLTNDDNATISYKNYDECGWFLDKTFPEYNNATEIGLQSTCFLDLDNLLIVKYRNKSGFTDEFVSEVINKEFIPKIINVREFIAKAHVITFNEEVDGSNIQFGNFNWGDIIE